MGLLNGASELAFLGPMLVFGVLVDRMRRKPLMIGTDLGRAAMIALVPVLAWTGTLAMPVLYLVALVVGCLTAVFSLAYQAYLPTIVDSEVLLAGNSRLQATESVSRHTGWPASLHARPAYGRVCTVKRRCPASRAGRTVVVLACVSRLPVTGCRTHRGGATTCRPRCGRVAPGRATGTCPRGRPARARTPSRCGRRRHPRA